MTKIAGTKGNPFVTGHVEVKNLEINGYQPGLPFGRPERANSSGCSPGKILDAYFGILRRRGAPALIERAAEIVFQQQATELEPEARFD